MSDLWTTAKETVAARRQIKVEALTDSDMYAVRQVYLELAGGSRPPESFRSALDKFRGIEDGHRDTQTRMSGITIAPVGIRGDSVEFSVLTESLQVRPKGMPVDEFLAVARDFPSNSDILGWLFRESDLSEDAFFASLGKTLMAEGIPAWAAQPEIWLRVTRASDPSDAETVRIYRKECEAAGLPWA